MSHAQTIFGIKNAFVFVILFTIINNKLLLLELN